MLVDVHTHIDFPQFDRDRRDVIKRAEKEKIVIINSGMGSGGMKKTLELIKEYENVYATFGVSPTEFNEGEIKDCIKLIRDNRDSIVGIGEVGLDYHWIKDSSERIQEMNNFRGFIDLSNELNLPLVVHSRGAEGDVIKALRDSGSKAILHCFSGSVAQAEEAVKSGNLISIPASVVYSKQKQEMVRRIPLKHLVLETDAPFLSPVPKTRNEPVNIKLSIRKISEVKGVNTSIVEDTTTLNAKKFLNLD
ncbi:MAG: TatD family hydrolase [Candidatus Altiarchaeota archaeon]|nr:TatD family hydrolase [Candidatus Altiarchaeota archaeon]